jgi:hypothetical protein
MPNRKINATIEQMASEEPGKHSHSVEDWRAAFESFQSWPYDSLRVKIDDFRFIVLKGFTMLQGADYAEEVIDLADWALDNPLIKEASNLLPDIYFSKAVAINYKMGPPDALSYFVGCFPLVDLKYKPLTFYFGLFLLKYIVEEPTTNTTEAPAYVVEYARRLFQIRYPKRPLPVPLRENYSKNPTWAETYKSLTRHLKREDNSH